MASKKSPNAPPPPLPFLKLQIEMVPTTAWGQNLRLSLPQGKWNKLRRSVHEKNGMKCQICGSPNKLNCHEEWKFDEETGVQKLIGLGTVCNMCHHAAHIGRSKQLAAAGHLDINAVVEHFLSVNGVDIEVFIRHESEAIDKWLHQSTIEWTQDFGEYAELLPATPVKPRKKRTKQPPFQREE